MIAHHTRGAIMGWMHGAALATGDEQAAFQFITVDDTRLRYLDTGTGTPVVLLHGNGSMIEDFLSSGVMDAPDHRFIAFDRPGFGHSDRPRDRVWSPWEQARLFLRASARLGVERPIVVGHSWGSLVALAMALRSPDDVAGLVLLSGYYYPIPRAESPVGAGAFPFTRVVLHHTVTPFMRRLLAPGTVRRVFAPCAVPDRFKQAYPLPLALRASQMRSVDEEAAMLLESAKALCPHYEKIGVPVHIIAGSQDQIVDTEAHSVRLHEELAFSTLQRVPACGHMVHHAASEDVLAAIAALARLQGIKAVARAMASTAPRRNWLHIGESLVAA
jgi:pimeloyl-ACP methyl ester carboxylesterase